ncbi:glycosyltransferase family 61 protein [Pseudomonas sp. QD4]|uniref:glycosyltransferase family 61 protein n=1 Tax=Pseudomonas sp. QD4 TaxID=3368618 RepID=UPI003B9EB9F9
MITYRGLYRAFCLLKNKFNLTTYKMISLSASSEILPCTKILVEEQQTLEIPAPRFSGFCAAQASQKNQAILTRMPRLEIYEFKNVVLIGGVDFILKKDLAIHHDLFIASAHHMPAEYRGVAAIDHSKNTVKFYLTTKSQALDNAVNLIGQCNGNYAHWLTETLPKLALLDAQDRYADFPLVVDDGLHENIYRSLEQINQKRRAIIKIGRWNRLTVANCVTVSHTGYERYAPHGLRSVEPPAFVNIFSRLALRALREVALQGLHEKTTNKHRIYLARNKTSGNIRHVENRTAIDAVIEANNINFIHPDSMTFMEQVFSCKDATVIIAPVGAALANMIFAPPGCTIIALAPYYDQASYFYYSNLSGALGHTIHYVLGQQASDKQHPIHRNYTIDPETLSAVIKRVMSLE